MARALVRSMFKPGYRYKKAGVGLLDLSHGDAWPLQFAGQDKLQAGLSAAFLMLVRLERRRISGRFFVIPPPLIRLPCRFSDGLWTWFDRHDCSP